MLAVNESARNISWEVTRANLRVPVEGDIFIAPLLPRLIHRAAIHIVDGEDAAIFVTLGAEK